MTSISLFYVRGDDTDSGNLDLLVEAKNTVRAVQLWHTHFNLSEDQVPQWVGQVPLTGKEGAVDWNNIAPKYHTQG